MRATLLAATAAVSMHRASAAMFCGFPNGQEMVFDCAYPCGQQVIGGKGFDCSQHPSTPPFSGAVFTCADTYGNFCNFFDTTCARNGMQANSSGPSAAQECRLEAETAPYDGGCGTGCTADPCVSGIFQHPPINTSNPFDNATLTKILRGCIAR